MAGFLPLEIVREILVRLPVESLVRFTCVCKQWHSLITSSDFITTHLCFSAAGGGCGRPPLLLIRRFTDDPRTQTFSFHLNSSESPRDSLHIYNNVILTSPFRTRGSLFFRIVGSVNGVVCLSDDLFGHTEVIILWNPLIKRFVLLPHPSVVFGVVGPYMFVLGFGFDAKTNDYKVVRVSYVQGDKAPDVLPPRVEIYSLKQGCWREIKASGVCYSICEQFWSQCFVNGCVHWPAYEKKLGSIYNLILLFDVSEEKFKKMKVPESLIQVCPLNLCVAEFNGSLGVLVYGGGHCDVWIRKEYMVANSWTKMYSVELDMGEKVLGLRANGEFLVSRTTGNLVSYDLCKPDSFDLQILGFTEAFYAENYTESLVLLDKESRSVSYGGVKKKKAEDTNQRSSDSLEEEEDPSFILISEETKERENASRSARTTVDTQRSLFFAWQMSKFDRLLSEYENS